MFYENNAFVCSVRTMLVFVLILLFAASGCTSGVCRRGQYFSIPASQGSAGPVVARYSTTSLEMCQRTCRQYLNCKGILMTMTSSSLGTGTCEILSAILETPASLPSTASLYSRCPLSMTYHNELRSCYLFVAPAAGVSPTNALNQCRTVHPDAHLAEITTEKEQQYIAQQSDSEFTKSFWIGGKRVSGTTFKWSHSNELLTYINWTNNGPSTTPGFDYVAVDRNSKRWLPLSDAYRFQFVCEYSF